MLKPQLNKSAGSDYLVFTYPDGSTKRISVTIQSSAQPARIVLHSSTNAKLLDNNITFPAVIELFDDRGNRIKNAFTAQLDTFGSIDVQ